MVEVVRDTEVRSICMGRDPPGPNEVSRMLRGGDIRSGKDTQVEHTCRARCVCSGEDLTGTTSEQDMWNRRHSKVGRHTGERCMCRARGCVCCR